MMRRSRRLLRDDTGSVMVEVAVLIPIIFVFILGIVDFLNAFRQWNAAAKAVEVGARIAAVSDPLAPGLNGLAKAAVTGSVFSGDNMPTFKVACDGSTGTCTCTGTCTGVGTTIPTTAMNTLLYGRGNTACNATPNGYYFAGMCNFLPGIAAKNVVVTYQHDKDDQLGYAGRSDGPVATITVALNPNLLFQFFFLNFVSIPIPPQSTTITSEAMLSGTSS
jgi:Flp pilus assembly protein TadG